MTTLTPAHLKDLLSAVLPADRIHVLASGGFRVAPQSPQQVAQLLATCQGEKTGQTFPCPIPLSVDKLTAQALPLPLWLDLSELTSVRFHWPADLTIQVETGITLGELNALLATHGQRYPLSYSPEIRLLEILGDDRPAPETGVPGSQFSYPRDTVLGLEVVTTEGHVTKCGGHVVKNVTGYDLNKLYVGSRHTLGVITAATLRVQPLPNNFSQPQSGGVWGEAASLALELTVPLGKFSALCRAVESLLPIDAPALQLWPDAGLCYLIWSKEAPPQASTLASFLEALKPLLNELEGQCLVPVFPDRLLAVVNPLLLPEDPVARSLMAAIKHRLDPANIMRHRQLPFEGERV